MENPMRKNLLLFPLFALGCGKGGAEIPDPTPDSGEEQLETAETITYVFTDADSLLYVQVVPEEGYDGHSHVMRATNFTGELTYNQDDGSAFAAEFSLPVEDLAVDEDEMRTRVGYDEMIDAASVLLITEHMLAEDQLDAGNHDTISFVGTSLTVDGAVAVLTGDFTLVGQTNQVTVDLAWSQTATGVNASGTLVLLHSDYGIVPYSSSWGGDYLNAQAMTLTIELQGAPVE